MIRMADVLRFAGQSRVDVQVAVLEVVLTILLHRIYSSRMRDRLAFKGGTALRKLVFGSAGRFSEDLDFVVVGEDDDLAQLEIEELLTADADDEVSVRVLGSEVAGPGTMQASCSFSCPLGEGRFELDIASRQRPLLIGATTRPLAPQPYFPALGFAPAAVLAVHSCEMAAEKLCALHRRSGNRNPKDVWDLWKWFGQAQPGEADIVRMLWPARLWHDRVQWRGSGWLEDLDAARFNWDRLRPLVPGGRLEPNRILAELKARVRPWIDADKDGILADAGDLRFRARHQVERRIDDARQRLGT